MGRGGRWIKEGYRRRWEWEEAGGGYKEEIEEGRSKRTSEKRKGGGRRWLKGGDRRD